MICQGLFLLDLKQTSGLTHHSDLGLEVENLFDLTVDLIVSDGGAELPDQDPGNLEHEGLVGGDVLGVALSVHVHREREAELGLVNLLPSTFL